MNLDPQMIQAILASGEADPQAQVLKRQQAQADMLRRQGMQQAPGINAGRIYNANVGGQMMNMAAGHQARQMQPGIDAGTQAMGQRNVDAKQKYLDAMMMAMRKPYPPTEQPMLPPDGMEDQ